MTTHVFHPSHHFFPEHYHSFSYSLVSLSIFRINYRLFFLAAPPGVYFVVVGFFEGTKTTALFTANNIDDWLNEQMSPELLVRFLLWDPFNMVIHQKKTSTTITS